jgi:hypothetical protein
LAYVEFVAPGNDHYSVLAVLEAEGFEPERTVFIGSCDLEVRGGLEACFLRGDCNGSGAIEIGDAVAMLVRAFLVCCDFDCRAACDANGDGGTSGVADSIHLLTARFLGGVEIPAPHPSCGQGALASDERLGCRDAPPGCAR